MAENVSWIKKPSTILSRRTTLIKDLAADINSTLNMLNSNSQPGIVRPPKRKSCMMFKERKIVQVPSEKKVKPNERGPTEFKNRTLKMIHGQRLSIARPGALRPRSQLPCPKTAGTGARLQVSPLHMSTPCEPPRSILKSNKRDIISSVRNRVNFDQVEPGVFPLQESTIQDFTQYDFKKLGTVSKSDASTNTDDIPQPECEEAKEKDIFALLNQLRNDILDIKSKVDGLDAKVDLSKQMCSCKTSYSSVNTPNQTEPFGHQLENIEEETPEESIKLKEEFKSISVGFSKLSDVQEESCSSTENTVHKNSEKENIPENVVEIIKEPIGHLAISNLIEEDTVDNVTSSDTEHKRRISKLQVSSPIKLKLRNLRKRNMPRHLNSFQLSPKPKRGSQKE